MLINHDAAHANIALRHREAAQYRAAAALADGTSPRRQELRRVLAHTVSMPFRLLLWLPLQALASRQAREQARPQIATLRDTAEMRAI